MSNNQTTADRNLQKLEKLFSLMDKDALTDKSFIEAFEKVIAFVKKIEAKNIQEVAQLKQAFASVSNKLKEDNSVNLSDVRAEIKKVFDKVIKEQSDGMNFLRDKTRGFTDGKDGLDADEDIIVDKVLDKIKLPEQKDIILDNAESIANKLETLKEDERLDVKAIKGIKKLFEGMTQEIKTLKERPIFGGVMGRDIIKEYDLSSSLDGSTKTFSLPAFWRILDITSSSFPTTFRKTIDYTTSEKDSTITFTSEVDASTMLQGGQSITILYVSA